MKKVFVYSLIMLVWFTTSTCQKIWEAPDSMYGIWEEPKHRCGYMLLILHKGGKSEYKSTNSFKGCHMNIKGQVRFSMNALYIGMMRLEYINKPKFTAGNDSVFLTYNNGNSKEYGKKSKVYSSMKLRESSLYGGGTYTFYKSKNF